jgi:hypothetical protein
MKKITLLLALIISVTANAQLSEDFESGTFPPAGWTSFIGANGLGTVESWESQAFNTTTAICIWEVLGVGERSEDWLVSPQFTVLATAPLLYFDSVDSGTTEYGSIYTVRVSTASQTTHADFTIVDTQTEADITHSQTTMVGSTRSIDLSAYVGQSIYVAFVLEQNDGDSFRLDNVLMSSDIDAPAPVTTPTPADGAIDVFVDPTDNDLDALPDNVVAFDWTPAITGDAATSYDVYLGDSPTTLALLGSTPNDQVNITGMAYSTLYYWQIVATNGGGEAVGSVIWSFTTEADPNLSVEDVEVNNFSHHYNNDTKILSLESANSSFTSVEIYSILGGKALSMQLSNNFETIDVSSLSTGVYLAKVKANGNSKTIKFIKN